MKTEIIKALQKAAGKKKPTVQRLWHRGDDYIAWGMRMGVWRKVMNGFKADLLGLPLKQRLKLAQDLCKENIGELGHSAIYILHISRDELTPKDFAAIHRMVGDFMGWDHVDYFCIDVMQPLLKTCPRETLALLKKWNSDNNPWRRRSSVVVFVRKIGASGKYTNQALKLCNNLIWDKEDLVQKGVGWALKDVLRGDPDKIIPYVKKLRRMGVASTITLYAIRDLKGKPRADVLKVKKVET